MTNAAKSPYVSRAGLKLAHGLDAFDFEVDDLVCADFGCNVGGFTDCLLQRGARRVYAIDTGYGTLAYKLRTDERVVVMERTNALHAAPPDEAMGLITIDMAWTSQHHAIPAALGWLAPHGHIITLVKPHYELTAEEKKTLLDEGRLAHDEAARVLERVIEAMPALGAQPLAHTKSPITGGKSARKAGKGNIEFLVLAERADSV